ncbi:MAG: formylglycine-generating enzyme family protein [Verrucomicrobia bacterium]|nr:formylglycine-generating enzyme family protein [Verrucomicrobiota bacterium]
MNNKMNNKIIIGLLALGLIGTMAYAEEPTISYAVKMEITYTGVLYQSTDGENWTEVEGATSPYYISMDDAKKFFFCSKGSESKNITIPLSDDVDLDMVWIRPGTFIMGSPEDELSRLNRETLHQVTLTKAYWLGKYEVTQAQYEAIMGTNPSWFKGADLPVECVNWNEAMAFCEKLTEIEAAAGRLPQGYEYTLPTEAQWEYACRAGTTTALNSGKNLSDKYQCSEMDEVGWYGYNSGRYDSDGNLTDNGKTFTVGQKKPNTWGLYDMHGNVWEWCFDRYGYGDYPLTAEKDPIGALIGSNRIARGGAWSLKAWQCRSAHRGVPDSDMRASSFGFRVALAPVK